MFVVICLVSLCSQVYSLGYLKGDRRFTIYYAWLSLFTASMLNLVIADNLFQLLVGWELVGICSYLLIGHWWEEKENSDAAIKAFITTKTGDVPFLFGIFALTLAAGTAEHPRDHGEGRRRRHLDRAPDDLRAAAVRRRDRQERAVPAAGLAAGRDGRPDPGVRADPRRDHGAPPACTWSPASTACTRRPGTRSRSWGRSARSPC